jgi:predicted PurR-regulated permease PerM
MTGHQEAEPEADRGAGTEPRGTGARIPPPSAQPDAVRARLRPGALYRWGFFAGLGLLSSLAAAMLLYSVRDILLRVVVAIFLAVSLDPAVRWLTGRGVRRGLAVTIIFTVFLALLASFLMSVIPPLVNQFGQLVRHFPQFLASLQEKSGRFRELDGRYHLSARLEGVLDQLPGRLTGGVLGLTSQVFGVLVSFLTVVVFTVYFLLDLPRLRRGVVRLFPVERRERYGRVVDIMVDKVGDYMIGRLAIGFIAGVVAFAGLEALHVPYPLPLAIFIGLLDLIPLLGHPIGSLAGVLVALLTKGVWPTTVLLAIFFVLYQQVENYLIAPRVLRHSVDISAAAVLLAALVGAAVMGVVGALVAIPLAAALKVVLVQQIDHYEAQAEAAATSARSHPHLPRLRRRSDPASPPDQAQAPPQPSVEARGPVEAHAPREARAPGQGHGPSEAALEAGPAGPPHA